MFQHWQQEPPADVLIAGFLGYKPPPKPGQRRGPLRLMAQAPSGDLDKFRRSFPQGRAGIGDLSRAQATGTPTVPDMGGQR